MKILAYRGKSIVSKLIRWQTRSIYSHIAVELDDGSIIEAWLTDGVVHRDSFNEGHTDGTPVDFFRIKGFTDSSEAEKFLWKQVGKKYDWISVFRFLWHTAAEKNNRWFCSELAEKALETASNKLLRGNCSEHSPRDTAMSTLLEFEYTEITSSKRKP